MKTLLSVLFALAVTATQTFAVETNRCPVHQLITFTEFVADPAAPRIIHRDIFRQVENSWEALKGMARMRVTAQIENKKDGVCRYTLEEGKGIAVLFTEHGRNVLQLKMSNGDAPIVVYIEVSAYDTHSLSFANRAHAVYAPFHLEPADHVRYQEIGKSFTLRRSQEVQE